MSNTSFSVKIDDRLKPVLRNHCRDKGLKMSRFVEDAISDKLEDFLDIECYHARYSEPRVPLSVIIPR